MNGLMKSIMNIFEVNRRRLKKFSRNIVANPCRHFDASVIYFYANAELLKFAAPLFGLLGIHEYEQDWENTWEWIENDEKSSLHLNFSRRQKHAAGGFNSPLIMRVRSHGVPLSAYDTYKLAFKITNSICADSLLGEYTSLTKATPERLLVKRRFVAKRHEYTLIKSIICGGVHAVGFDETSSYLLVVSHSGVGVYDIKSSERVSREYETIYHNDFMVNGIGPLSGQLIYVDELIDGVVEVRSNAEKFQVVAKNDGIEILKHG